MKVTKTTLARGVQKTALIFNVLYAEYSYSYSRDPQDSRYDPSVSWQKHRYGIVPVGRRLAVIFDPSDGYEDYKVGELIEGANLVASPKTLRRILEEALAGKSGEEYVQSGYGRALIFVPKGKHLYFRAPCGQHARITKAEARKILEALPQLTG